MGGIKKYLANPNGRLVPLPLPRMTNAVYDYHCDNVCIVCVNRLCNIVGKCPSFQAWAWGDLCKGFVVDHKEFEAHKDMFEKREDGKYYCKAIPQPERLVEETKL